MHRGVSSSIAYPKMHVANFVVTLDEHHKQDFQNNKNVSAKTAPTTVKLTPYSLTKKIEEDDGRNTKG